ncbi:uncharacterized protein [Apostichopus japonicus]|uniref:uncharacterized protein isoform X2 n=1 Tax=Stichopus japonicus TaxID=307972 RepID=UPI003AB69822
MYSRPSRRHISSAAPSTRRSKHENSGASYQSTQHQQQSRRSQEFAMSSKGNKKSHEKKTTFDKGGEEVKELPIVRGPKSDLSSLQWRQTSARRSPKDGAVMKQTHSDSSTSGSKTKTRTRQIQFDDDDDDDDGSNALASVNERKQSESSKSGPYSLAAQIHKVKESISSSSPEVTASVRRKRLSARKSTSGRSNFSLPQETICSSPGGSHVKREEVIAVDDEVSFKLPVEQSTRNVSSDIKQRSHDVYHGQKEERGNIAPSDQLSSLRRRHKKNVSHRKVKGSSRYHTTEVRESQTLSGGFASTSVESPSSNKDKNVDKHNKTNTSLRTSYEESEKTTTSIDGKHKFQFVTLNQTPTDFLTSPASLPRSKYTRSAFSGKARSTCQESTGSQSGEGTSIKNTDISGSKYVTYSSKLSKGQNIKEGWKMMSVRDGSRKKPKSQPQRKHKSQMQSWTTISGNDSDEEEDSNLAYVDNKRDKDFVPKRSFRSTKGPKKEVPEISGKNSSERNIFDMFQIPARNNTSTHQSNTNTEPIKCCIEALGSTPSSALHFNESISSLPECSHERIPLGKTSVTASIATTSEEVSVKVTDVATNDSSDGDNIFDKIANLKSWTPNPSVGGTSNLSTSGKETTKDIVGKKEPSLLGKEEKDSGNFPLDESKGPLNDTVDSNNEELYQQTDMCKGTTASDSYSDKESERSNDNQVVLAECDDEIIEKYNSPKLHKEQLSQKGDEQQEKRIRDDCSSVDDPEKGKPQNVNSVVYTSLRRVTRSVRGHSPVTAKNIDLEKENDLGHPMFKQAPKDNIPSSVGESSDITVSQEEEGVSIDDNNQEVATEVRTILQAVERNAEEDNEVIETEGASGGIESVREKDPTKQEETRKAVLPMEETEYAKDVNKVDENIETVTATSEISKAKECNIAPSTSGFTPSLEFAKSLQSTNLKVDLKAIDMDDAQGKQRDTDRVVENVNEEQEYFDKEHHNLHKTKTGGGEEFDKLEKPTFLEEDDDDDDDDDGRNIFSIFENPQHCDLPKMSKEDFTNKTEDPDNDISVKLGDEQKDVEQKEKVAEFEDRDESRSIFQIFETNVGKNQENIDLGSSTSHQDEKSKERKAAKCSLIVNVKRLEIKEKKTVEDVELLKKNDGAPTDTQEKSDFKSVRNVQPSCGFSDPQKVQMSVSKTPENKQGSQLQDTNLYKDQSEKLSACVLEEGIYETKMVEDVTVSTTICDSGNVCKENMNTAHVPEGDSRIEDQGQSKATETYELHNDDGKPQDDGRTNNDDVCQPGAKGVTYIPSVSGWISDDQPPNLQHIDSICPVFSQSKGSSDESECMPIIVSVASVESGDTFKTPGEVSHKESPGSLEKEGFESKRSAEESEISSPNIVQCQGSVTTDVLVGSSAAAVGYDEDNIGQNPPMGTASESNGNFGGSETIAAEEREVDVIDGISFLSFASKEDLIRYTATSNRKGKGKRKSTSVLGITWAMSKRKRKLLKKSPKPQKLSIFPGNLKEQSQKQIEDYQNTFLQDLKQQKRKEILHPALLKRGVSIKRSLDCGIPLVLDLELLGVNLDKEDGPPKKKKKKKKRKKSHKSHDTVYEVLSSVVKEASPKPSLNTDDDDDKEISYFDDIDDFDQETLDTYTTENSDDETGNDLRQDIFDQSNRLADASGTDLQKRSDQSTRIEEPLQTQSLSTIVEDTSKKDGPVSGILTNENEVFKPFEKPVISHTAAFQSSELDLYLDKEVKEKTGTPGTRDKEKKKSLSSRHMKRLNSAIQGISLSSLFTGKRPSDKIPSFSKKVADPNKLNVRKEVAGIDTISEQRAMVTSGGSKTRIGNTILRKSTAGAARFHRDLKVRAAVDKKDHLVRKGEIPQPKASNSDLNWQSDRSSKQSTFLDRLVHNVRQATGSEMKPSSKPKSVKSSSMKDQDSTAKIDRLVHNVSQATGTEMEASSKPKLVKSALLKDQDSTAKIDRLVHNVRQATGTEKEASIKPKLVKSALLTDQDSTAKIDRLVQNVSQATGTEMETSSKPKLAKPSSLKDQDSTAKKLIVEAQKVDRSDYTSLKIVQNRIIHVSTMENMRVASSGFLPVRDPTSPSIKKQLTKVVEKKDDEPSSRPPVRKSKRKQSFKVPCIPEEGPPMLRDYDALPGMPAKCGSDFCRLGCICDSLSWKAEEDLQHCRKLECMFECSCERFPSLRILRARKRPAIFRADGMVFYDETGLMSDHDNGKKKRLDPSRSKEKSCEPAKERVVAKVASKPVRTTAFSKVIEKKKEVPIKETKNVITKQLKKDPGFSRGRVYIAKHIRYAARMEEQKQEDLKRAKSAAEQGSSGSSVSHGEGRLPPLKVVRTSAGFAVKTTVPDEETQDGFRLLKRVDRMMLNNQQYRRRKAEVLASEQAEEEDNVEKMNMAKRNETEATSKASNGEDEQGDKSDTNATVQSEKGRNQDDGKNTIEELVWKSRRKDAEQGKHMTSNVSIKKHSNAVKPPSTKDPAVQTSIVAQPSKPFDKVAQSTELVTNNMTNLQSTPVPAKQLLLSLPGVAQHTFTPILQQGSVKTGINPPIILQPNLIPILPKSNVTPIQTVSKMLVQKRKNKNQTQRSSITGKLLPTGPQAEGVNKSAVQNASARNSQGNTTIHGQPVILVPAAASDGSKAKNIQAFLVHNPDGKAVLLVPTQTPDKNPELAIPGVSGAVPRAENRKATSVKESLSALRQPQRVKRLCDIAGHATSLVHLKQKHPFKNLRSVFVPNNHPCNTNRAFHLLVDVFSNCSWEQDAANLNQPIFNLAAKAGTVPHLKIAKYTVQRIGFKKHSQAARCINVSSSVAGNCREKIRIIGLFESKFFITDGREPLLQITELAPIPCQSKATKVDAPNKGEPIGTGEKSQQSGVEIHGSERKYETELKSEADVGKEKAIEGRIKDLTANVEVVHTIDDSSEEGNSNSLESVGSQLQPGKGSQPQDDISTGENLKLQPALVSRDSESAVCRRDQTFSEKDLVKLSSQPLGESADDRSISGPDKIEIGNNESAQGMKSFRAVESFPATNVSLEKRDTSANKSKEQHDRHSCHDEQVATTTTTSRQKEDCKVVRNDDARSLTPEQSVDRPCITADSSGQSSMRDTFAPEGRANEGKPPSSPTKSDGQCSEDHTEVCSSPGFTLDGDRVSICDDGGNMLHCSEKESNIETAQNLNDEKEKDTELDTFPTPDIVNVLVTKEDDLCLSSSSTSHKSHSEEVDQIEGSKEDAVNEDKEDAVTEDQEEIVKELIQNLNVVRSKQNAGRTGDCTQGEELAVATSKDDSEFVVTSSKLQTTRTGVEDGTCLNIQAENENIDKKLSCKESTLWEGDDKEQTEKQNEESQGDNTVAVPHESDISVTDGKSLSLETEEIGESLLVKEENSKGDNEQKADELLIASTDSKQTEDQNAEPKGDSDFVKQLDVPATGAKSPLTDKTDEIDGDLPATDGIDEKDAKDEESRSSSDRHQQREEQTDSLKGEADAALVSQTESVVPVTDAESHSIDETIENKEDNLPVTEGIDKSDYEEQEQVANESALTLNDGDDKQAEHQTDDDDDDDNDDDDDDDDNNDSKREETTATKYEDSSVSDAKESDQDPSRTLHNLVENLSSRVTDTSTVEKVAAEAGDKEQQRQETDAENDTSEDVSSEDDDDDTSSDSDSDLEEVEFVPERKPFFVGATTCTIPLSTLVEKAFAGENLFTACWPEGYLNTSEQSGGTPKAKLFKSSFLKGSLSGNGAAWPLKPRRKEVKFMSPDALSSLLEKRQVQREADREKARKLANLRKKISFRNLPPSQRLPKRDKVRSLEYCVVEKKVVVSDEDIDILALADDDDDLSSDEDSIYTTSSYEDEQRSKNEALFRIAELDIQIKMENLEGASRDQGCSMSEQGELLSQDTDQPSSDAESVDSTDGGKSSDSQIGERRRSKVDDTNKKVAELEKELYRSSLARFGSDDEEQQFLSGDDDKISGGRRALHIHILKERQRRANQRRQFTKLSKLVFHEETVWENRPKIAILQKALEAVKDLRDQAKILDEQLSAQRYRHYCLRNKVKAMLQKNPHLSQLLCQPMEGPPNGESKTAQEEEAEMPNLEQIGFGLRNLIPEQNQQPIRDVAKTAQQLLMAMQVYMKRSGCTKDSICHWTIESMLDNGIDKLPSHLKTKEILQKAPVEFDWDDVDYFQRARLEKAERWRKKKAAALMKNEADFSNDTSPVGSDPSAVDNPAIEKVEDDDGETDPQQFPVNSLPMSALSSPLKGKETNYDSDESSSDSASAVVTYKEDAFKYVKLRKVKRKRKSKKSKKSKRKRRKYSFSEDEGISPFGNIGPDSDGEEDGWIDDEDHHGDDGWEEEDVNVVDDIGDDQQTTDIEARPTAAVSDQQVAAASSSSSHSNEESEKFRKEIVTTGLGWTLSENSPNILTTKQGNQKDDVADINIDEKKIIPCLQVEEKDDGTLDVVLQGEFSDERLDELFARPGVMDYLKKVAASKKRAKSQSAGPSR